MAAVEEVNTSSLLVCWETFFYEVTSRRKKFTFF